MRGRGGVAERLIAAVLKTVEAQVSVGSNPTPSAKRRRPAVRQQRRRAVEYAGEPVDRIRC